jgi:hypothetical protein
MKSKVSKADKNTSCVGLEMATFLTSPKLQGFKEMVAVLGFSELT